MKKTIVLSVILLLCSVVKAQEGEILYIDFEPDSTHHFTENHEELFLDLDQDGVNEWCYDNTHGYGHNVELRLCSVFFNDPDYEVTYVHKLHPNDFYSFQYGDTLSNFMYEVPIYAQYAWGEEHHWTGTIHHPEDHYFEPHYMGIRKRVGEGKYCYGWIEASVYIHTWAVYYGNYQYIDLTVYRAAYCTIPNYPLRFGQTNFSWGTEEAGNQHYTSVYPNPSTNEVLLMGPNLKQIDVYNTLGQWIMTQQADGDRATINLNKQPAGLYFLSVTDTNGRRHVKKVVKQ